MSIANFFYHSQLRKYITVFGSLFNKMSIERRDASNAVIQRMPVPIHYAPFQKFLARIKQDPTFGKKSAIALPQMSFEIVSIQYDPMRNISAHQKIKSGERTSVYTPSPYNISFVLNIMTQYREDAAQIIEQILPFFKPHYSATVEMLPGAEPIDLYFNLESIAQEEVYDGNFEQRESIIWTLNFQMKGGYFYGPIREEKVIKFIDVDTSMSKVTTQPGMDEFGNPTKDVNESIDWHLINKDDDWSFITTVTIKDETDEP